MKNNLTYYSFNGILFWSFFTALLKVDDNIFFYGVACGLGFMIYDFLNTKLPRDITTKN